MSDIPARISPDSLRHSVIYQLFLRAFTPEGTLNAAAKLLPHLAEIGVDIVYLCPVVTADDDPDTAHWSDRQNKSGIQNPKNPYRMSDYFTVDPEYGTNDDLRVFVRTAHQLGLSVMLDLVYLHCGPKAVFLDEHPDFVKRTEDGDIAFGPWHFPLLNFDNEELRDYLIENMIHFVLEYGVDGYRCDVATSIPLDFWEEARAALDDYNPDLILLSEGEKPEYQECAFDMSYNFAWSGRLTNVFDQQAPASILRDLWETQYKSFPAGNLFIRGNDNHDIANDQYNNRLETRWTQNATDAALLLNFTIDGIPFVYNGQEIADAARHSIYGNRFHSHSLCIDWSKALTAEGTARLEFFKKLTDLRHECGVLCEGETLFVNNSAPAELISFLRLPAALADELRNDECDCGCGCGPDCTCGCQEGKECTCHDDDDDEEETGCGCGPDCTCGCQEGQPCTCHDDHCGCGCDDDDCEDDGCGCGDSRLLVVINTSAKPLAASLEFQLERGTLLQVKMLRGAEYSPNGDRLTVNILPFGFLVLEF